MILRGADLPPLAWQHRDPYDPTHWRPVAALYPAAWVKPHGGLWTSPLHEDGGTHWTQWCIGEDFGNPDAPLTRIIPDADAVVYVIDNHGDLLRFEARFPTPHQADAYRFSPAVDWGKAATEIDAVFLTDAGQHRTRHTSPGMYGWDCATVLFMQPRFTAVPA